MFQGWRTDSGGAGHQVREVSKSGRAEAEVDGSGSFVCRGPWSGHELHGIWFIRCRVLELVPSDDAARSLIRALGGALRKAKAIMN
jgi:hypothetical protein